MPDPTITAAALPKMGEYMGKPIDLAEAQATLSAAELAEVVVNVPGRGRIRPWRFVQSSDDLLADDAVIID